MTTTLYKRCYQTVVNVFDVICDEYYLSPLDVVLDKVYEEVISDKYKLISDLAEELNSDIWYVRNAMILILASTSYMYSYANSSRGIDSEYDYTHLSLLNSLDSNEIINKFYSDIEFAKDILNGFDNYYAGSYTLQSRIKEIIANDKEAGQILRINPLEVFNLPFYKKLTKIEEMIEVINGAHDKAEFSVESDELGESENYDNKQDFLFYEFLEALKSVSKDEQDMNTIVQYLIANVYECAVVNEQEDLQVYVDYFENASPEELVNRFYNDISFGYDMFELFFQFNGSLLPDTLKTRRKIFRKKKDTKCLKRLNPYLDK